MTTQAFLIKYGEIAIKGKNRHLFEDALVKQINHALKPLEQKFEIVKQQGRIFVHPQGTCDEEEVKDAISKVFGVVGFSPCYMTEDEGFEKLAEEIIDYMKRTYGDEAHTFKVDARRARKNYPLQSMEINAKMGEKILEAMPNMKVDVHNPEIWLHIEIREQISYYSVDYPGPGGMPVGTAGKAMLLLSGGIDSPVAGWMMAKRGVTVEAVYFHAPPYTSERAKQKVIDLAKKIAKYTGPIKLHIINFTDVQLKIYEECPHEELTIIMRRYMMRIAEHFAIEDECLGLITGESVGQVASQTMQSLNATNAVCTLPVYRPLVAFDKQDIVEISYKIDTYETSILPYEDCCTIFVAKHPVTKPKLEIIEKSEKKLEGKIEDLVKIAIDTREIMIVKGEN